MLEQDKLYCRNNHARFWFLSPFFFIRLIVALFPNKMFPPLVLNASFFSQSGDRHESCYSTLDVIGTPWEAFLEQSNKYLSYNFPVCFPDDVVNCGGLVGGNL